MLHQCLPIVRRKPQTQAGRFGLLRRLDINPDDSLYPCNNQQLVTVAGPFNSLTGDETLPVRVFESPMHSLGPLRKKSIRGFQGDFSLGATVFALVDIGQFHPDTSRLCLEQWVRKPPRVRLGQTAACATKILGLNWSGGSGMNMPRQKIEIFPERSILQHSFYDTGLKPDKIRPSIEISRLIDKQASLAILNKVGIVLLLACASLRLANHPARAITTAVARISLANVGQDHAQ